MYYISAGLKGVVCQRAAGIASIVRVRVHGKAYRHYFRSASNAVHEFLDVGDLIFLGLIGDEVRTFVCQLVEPDLVGMVNVETAGILYVSVV